MSISVITVNYNGQRFLKNLIQSLDSVYTSDFPFEFVFVDNASTDDSISEFCNLTKNITGIEWKVVKSNKNLGFAGGNNLGVKNAKYDFVYLLNNDTIPSNSFLSGSLETILNDESIGIVASKLVFLPKFIAISIEIEPEYECKLQRDILINGKVYTLDSRYGEYLNFSGNYLNIKNTVVVPIPLPEEFQSELKINFFLEDSKTKTISIEGHIYEFAQKIEIRIKIDNDRRRFDLIQNAGSRLVGRFYGQDIGSGELDAGQYDLSHDLEMACGAALLMKKHDFLKIGGFDEKFFMYYEDSDLSLRLKRKLGKRIVFQPKSIVRHIHTGSSKEWSPFFVYYVYRNRLLFILKNFSFVEFTYEYLKDLKNFVRACCIGESKPILWSKFRALLSVASLSIYYIGKRVIVRGS